MRRFFVDPQNIHGANATIDGAEAHHLRAVLRLRPGDLVTLFDGTGKIYQAEIRTISAEQVQTVIIATDDDKTEAPAVHLGQALLKGKKMDLVVQKATELGITSIHPFISEHCTVSAVNENKAERWNRVAYEACKQCGRAVPLVCHPATNLDALLAAGKDYDVKLIFWEQETSQGLKDVLTMQPVGSLLFLIGPEGGFSKEEVDKTVACGFQPVTLGKRTLRAETASLAAMAVLQFLLGNLG